MRFFFFPELEFPSVLCLLLSSTPQMRSNLFLSPPCSSLIPCLFSSIKNLVNSFFFCVSRERPVCFFEFSLTLPIRSKIFQSYSFASRLLGEDGPRLLPSPPPLEFSFSFRERLFLACFREGHRHSYFSPLREPFQPAVRGQ